MTGLSEEEWQKVPRMAPSQKGTGLAQASPEDGKPPIVKKQAQGLQERLRQAAHADA